MVIEIIKFLIYSFLIVIIAKYFLVRLLRKLAEALDLSAKVVGNITGIATSIPELLTICFSSGAGLAATSIYNVISSNVINFIQYLIVIIISKNYNEIKNKAIKIDLFLTISTIIFPIILINLNIGLELSIIPFFILLFIMFYYINTNAHNLYIKNSTKNIENKNNNKNTFKAVEYSIYILITAILLFLVGTFLSNSLRNLAVRFNTPELILGIVLGFITSIPELITFLESQKHYKKKERKEEGIVEATNNLFTSNILNLFVIQSVGIIIFTIFK